MSQGKAGRSLKEEIAGKSRTGLGNGSIWLSNSILWHPSKIHLHYLFTSNFAFPSLTQIYWWSLKGRWKLTQVLHRNVLETLITLSQVEQQLLCMIVWWKTVIISRRHCEIALKNIRPISNHQCDSAAQVSQCVVWCVCCWLRVPDLVPRCELGLILGARCLWMLMNSFILWDLLEFHLSYNAFHFMSQSSRWGSTCHA